MHPRQPPRPGGLCFLILFLLPPSWAFNVQGDAPRIFTGAPGSFFGLSVKLHKTSTGSRLLVGSPRANTTFEPAVAEPGGLFTCELTDPNSSCQPFELDSTGNSRGGSNPSSYKDKKDGQWMGVTLDATQGQNGSVVTCGHRWINNYYANHHLINGACYVTNAEMTATHRLLPLIDQFLQFPREESGPVYGQAYGQAGISAALSPYSQVLAVGAPGVYYWKGAVVHYETPIHSDMTIVEARSLSGNIPSFSYMGYSVAVGRLFSKESSAEENMVLGGPRADTSGLVVVLELKHGVSFDAIASVSSTQFGSYFGAAVCVVDLNADGLDDLVVGAPLYSLKNSPGGDHGAVFVYVSQEEKTLSPQPDGVFGLKKPWARFGQAIANAGKLLNLHYNSYVVGAPYEDDGKGAIYVYSGLAKTFSQRIAASSRMQGFGYGISGNLDVDDNGYPDIAVGAYESDQAALYLTRPVVNIVAQMTFDKKEIDLEKDTYELGGVHYPALKLTIVLNYTGVGLPDSLEVEYIIEVDTLRAGIRAGRGHLVIGSTTRAEVTNTTVLQKAKAAVFNYMVVFENRAKDVTSPFDSKLSFKLINEASRKVKGLIPMLNGTMDKQIYTNVHFAKKCGKDDRCDSELQLRQTVETPTGKSYLILGDDRPLDLSVQVENKGEAAYQSVVVFEHPVDLHFRSLTQIGRPSSRERVSCFPMSPTEGTKYQLQRPLTEIGLLNCEVGNPIPANRTVSFRITFEAQKVVDNKRPLMIAVRANTTSNETVPANNQLVARIPLVIEASIQLSGSSKPDQLQFAINSTTESISDTEIVFQHYYDVKNKGPGLIPNANFDLNIPEKKDTGDDVTSQIQVTMTTYGESSITKACGKLPDPLPPFPIEKPPRTTFNQVENVAEPLDLDCSSTHCLSFRCPIKDLKPRESAIIKVAIRMKVNQDMEDRVTTFFTEARLTTNTTKVNNDVTEPGKLEPHIEYRLVRTAIYPQELVPSRFRIKLWVLLVSVFAGLLALIILIVALWKLGFFKRQRLDDTQRLVRENDDNDAQEAGEEVDVKPPTAGGRDDIPGYEDNISNNANHASYTAQSRTGPMYGQLSMIDDEVSDNGSNNNNNNNNIQEQEKIVEDRDEAGGVLVYSPFPYNHPPAPPVPNHPRAPEYDSHFDSNPLNWRPPPPHHTTWSGDGYLLPTESRL